MRSFRYCSSPFCLLVLLACLVTTRVFADDAKPKAAIFPLGGTATDVQRDKVGFALRAKLDRLGIYEVVDGPMMKDLASAATSPITLATPLEDVRKLATDVSPAILMWGELDKAGEGFKLRLHTFDSRAPDAGAKEIEKAINQPTDLRFVTEEVLETLPGVQPFDHPSEVSVKDDPESAAAFARNPNLVVGGDFETPEAAQQWDALLRDQKYKPPMADAPPAVDHVAIIKNPDGEGHVLAMKLSDDVAQSNGLACISAPMKIEPKTRYRLQFRYKSDGPSLHVFVKGYSTINGEEREVYRRQVPPSDKTHGKWVTIIDDLNPQHVQYPVERLRVDLYAYLGSGTVLFDDVVLKAVGGLSHVAKDDAIKLQPK